jgi:hypothetical protein
MLGYQMSNSYAQNSTVPAGSTAGIFGTELGLTIGVITTLIIAITGLLKVLPLGPLLGKYITATADGAHAMYDLRMTIGETGAVLASMTPEQQQEYIKTTVIPTLQKLQKMGKEYEPKVKELTELAAKFGKPLASINFGNKFESGDIPTSRADEFK